MNTNLQYAFFSENFEIYQYKHRTYGHGVWYDPSTETYDAAYDRARVVALDKFEKDNPHLNSDVLYRKEDETHTATVTQNYIHGIPSNTVTLEIKKKPNADDVLKASLKEMMDATTLTELKTFETWARANDAGETYDLQVKKLSA